MLATTSTGEASAGPLLRERGLEQYIRKKKLDPLSSYIPPILLARDQISIIAQALDTPDEARRLLREGFMEGFRTNARAVAEYGQAEGLLRDVFKALGTLNFTLFSGARDPDNITLDKEAAAAQVNAAVAAIDALLATVPEDTMREGQKVLEVLRENYSST